MNQKSVLTIMIVAAILILGVVAYLILSDEPEIQVDVPDKVGDTEAVKILNPKSGEVWRVGEEYAVRWTPAPGTETVRLAIVNSQFNNKANDIFYRYNICVPTPPYPCEIPDAGELKFKVPPDDGHNEWMKSSNYQIALYGPSGTEPLALSDKFSIVYDASQVVVPPAPGPFAADAVRNLMPKSLKVGENIITAEVRGYMFFEGETGLKLYDGNTEVNIGKRPDGLPNTVVTAQGEWMIAGYVPVSQKINVPASLKGKTLVIRFIQNNPADDSRPKYWGTLIKVE